MSDPEAVPVRVSGVTRRFGERVALAGIDLELGPGRIAALVGPNGSGKTTLLKLLAGFLRPGSGEVRVFGRDPFRDRARVMRRTRFAFAPPALFETLSAREHLVHLAALGGPEPARADVERALETVGLEERADEPVRGFSFGMRQRLGLAQALLPLPDLLVLDEPAEGLDPLAVLELREILRRLREREGIAILLSSHLLVEVDRLVDELLVLAEGRTLFRGAPAELRSGSERLLLETDESESAAGALRERGLEPLEVASGRIVLAAGSLELEQAAGILRAAGARLRGYQHVRPTLEEALLARLRAARGRD